MCHRGVAGFYCTNEAAGPGKGANVRSMRRWATVAAVAVVLLAAVVAALAFTAAPASASVGPFFPFQRACKLTEPKKSDDACATDTDCGVSDPCHARACVAKAKSNPPGPATTCTRNLVCDSADANRCGCFEGRCALIPR